MPPDLRADIEVSEASLVSAMPELKERFGKDLRDLERRCTAAGQILGPDRRPRASPSAQEEECHHLPSLWGGGLLLLFVEWVDVQAESSYLELRHVSGCRQGGENLAHQDGSSSKLPTFRTPVASNHLGSLWEALLPVPGHVDVEPARFGPLFGPVHMQVRTSGVASSSSET